MNKDEVLNKFIDTLLKDKQQFSSYGNYLQTIRKSTRKQRKEALIMFLDSTSYKFIIFPNIIILFRI